MIRKRATISGIWLLLACFLASHEMFGQESSPSSNKSNDSFPAMSAKTLPADIPALWSTFDATKDPLDVRILHQFEKEKDIFFTMQIVKLTPQFELKGIAFGVDKATENYQTRFSSLSDKYHQYRKPKKEHCEQTKS